MHLLIVSCVPLFKELKIIKLPCLYILANLLNVKENLEIFEARQDVHNYCTRNKYFLTNYRYTKKPLCLLAPTSPSTPLIMEYLKVLTIFIGYALFSVS